MSLPWQPEYSYRYCVVREEAGETRVDKTETITRTVALPDGLQVRGRSADATVERAVADGASS